MQLSRSCRFFFFSDTATTEIYTLSLHDALPIWHSSRDWRQLRVEANRTVQNLQIGRGGDLLECLGREFAAAAKLGPERSEEHTSELQSRRDLVCRLLLEKKKK